MKPILRWAGSKRQLVPVLKRFWNNDFNTYIEPFAGSACLFFDLEPKKAIIGDLNRELINMYTLVKQDPQIVYECYQRLGEGEEEYYKIRKRFSESLTQAEQAAIFIYLNLHCFNGLYRTNAKGEFNVPYGHFKKKREIDLKLLESASEKLKEVQLINNDFETVMNLAQENDFVYLDPPFWTEKGKTFSSYVSRPFGSNDLQRLDNLLLKLNERGAKFLVSYADSIEGLELLEKWGVQKVKTKRFISGKSSNRNSVYELLATNI